MENGDYTCPVCLGIMHLTKKAYRYREVFLGFYEAVECPICGSSFFTEKSLKKISRDYLLYKEAKIISEPYVSVLESRTRNKEIVTCNITEDTNEKLIGVGFTGILTGEESFSENRSLIIKEVETAVTKNAAG